MIESDLTTDYDPCAGWYFDEEGNIVCPSCGVLDPITGEQIKKPPAGR